MFWIIYIACPPTYWHMMREGPKKEQKARRLHRKINIMTFVLLSMTDKKLFRYQNVTHHWNCVIFIVFAYIALFVSMPPPFHPEKCSARVNRWNIDITSHTILLKATQNAIQLLLLCCVSVYMYVVVVVVVEPHIRLSCSIFYATTHKQQRTTTIWRKNVNVCIEADKVNHSWSFLYAYYVCDGPDDA